MSHCSVHRSRQKRSIQKHIFRVERLLDLFCLKFCKQLSECVNKENQCGKRVFAIVSQWLAIHWVGIIVAEGARVDRRAQKFVRTITCLV